MTVEDLMKPRYKVIASYPGSVFNVEEILPRSSDVDDRWHKWFKEGMADQYPHLFKPLAWWEEREVKDMPEYVKNIDGVYKVDKWDFKRSGAKCLCNKATRLFHAEQILPATIDEYNQYNKIL